MVPDLTWCCAPQAYYLCGEGPAVFHWSVNATGAQLHPLPSLCAATYTSPTTFGSLPASVMTAPPYEWPTRMTGPFCNAIALRGGHVVSERRGRLLNDRHGIAALLQSLVDASPSGPVHPAPWTSTTFRTLPG